MSWQVTAADDIDADGPGSATTGEVAGGETRAIILNGSTQHGRVTLPNAAPFTSMPGFQFVFRLRTITVLSSYVLSVRDSGGTNRFEVTYGSNSPDSLAVNDARDSQQAFHTPTQFSDSKYKVQYDPLNSRWTIESWKPDDSGHVQTTLAITTTTNWALGLGVLTIGSGYFDTAYLGVHIDYFRWIAQVDALNTSPPTADSPAGTYYADYRFENDGTDSSSVAGNLTLTNSPTYENTPP